MLQPDHVEWVFAYEIAFRLPAAAQCQRSCRDARRFHRSRSRNEVLI